MARANAATSISSASVTKAGVTSASASGTAATSTSASSRGRGSGRKPSRRSVSRRGAQDRALLIRGGVTDDRLEHEAIELGFRKRIRSLVLDRILRGENEEGIR